MTTPIDNLIHFLRDSNLGALLLDASLKSLAILACAGALGACCRRAPAATRHWVWSLATASLICLPLFSLALPAWRKPAWILSTERQSGNEVVLAFELAGAKSFGPGGTDPLTPAAAGGKTPQASAATSGHPSRLTTRFDGRWLVLVPALWFAGFAMVSAWNVAGGIRLRLWRRRAQPSKNHSAVLEELCDAMGIRRRVTLLRAAEDLMPMTWGSWRPVILLPAAADAWPAERLRVVLLHELAHVKRWDCLTQAIARAACALYWFNPLAWLAAGRMRVERERACDDLVINGGWRASDYAAHLLEIARSFRRRPHAAAIAMARSSGLEGRITAIVDASRPRHAPRAALLGLLGAAVIALVATLAAQKLETTYAGDAEAEALRRKQIARLQEFSRAKEKQSRSLAAKAKEEISPEFRRFFDAATKGDFQAVTNMYADFKRRHPQYEHRIGMADESLSTHYWSPVLEICLAYYDVAAGEPRYTQMAVDDIIGSIPAGSIYFGGTDPGRGLPTAFSRSHADADPFFILTQNALADDSYLEYLRNTYGGRIYAPTGNDSTNCFDAYKADARARMQKGQLRPGEDVRVVDNRVETSGMVAVMAVNALLAKLIFDKNPEREFYVEESFPLDWMNPHLEPHGLILKLNRQPLPSVSDEAIQRDRKFWTERVDKIVGPWLKEETSVQEIADFAEKVYARKDLSGFQGDPRFVRNEYPQKMFAKLRTSIAGVFAWRIYQAESKGDAAEKQRMIRAADYAFRQAYAMCPSSPEALYRYVSVLAGEKRFDDALALAKASSKAAPELNTLPQLIHELERLKAQNAGASLESADAAALAKMEAAYRARPADAGTRLALAQMYASYGRTNDVMRLADEMVAKPDADAAMISFAVQIYQQLANYPKMEAGLRRWTEVTPTPEAWLDYAASQAIQKKQDEAIASLARALVLNRERLQTNATAPNVLKTLGSDPRFASLKTNPSFRELLQGKQ